MRNNIDRLKALRARAERCAASFVRAGYLCAGCPLSTVCPLDQLWRAKYGPTLVDALLSDPVIQENVTFVTLAGSRVG